MEQTPFTGWTQGEIHEDITSRKFMKSQTKHISVRSNPEIERKVNCFLAAGVDNADANILKSDLQRHALSTFVVQWQKAIIENAECKYIDI